MERQLERLQERVMKQQETIGSLKIDSESLERLKASSVKTLSQYLIDFLKSQRSMSSIDKKGLQDSKARLKTYSKTRSTCLSNLQRQGTRSKLLLVRTKTGQKRLSNYSRKQGKS